MSASITPFYSMNVATGDAIMSQMALQYKTMQETKATMKKKDREWLAFIEKAAEPAPQQGTDLMANSLFGFMLDMLFGMGMFSGISSGIAEAAQGVAHIGAMEHTSRGNMQHAANINEELHKRALMNLQKDQSQNVKVFEQMVATMLMNYLANNGVNGTAAVPAVTSPSLKKSGNIVSSVWGQDTKEMFVKTRNEMMCATTLFMRNSDKVTRAVTHDYAVPQVA